MTATLDRVLGTRVSGHLTAGSVELYVLDCASCGVVFAITVTYEKRRRSDGSSFHCPNGHNNSWHETDADRARKAQRKAEREAAEAVAARDRARRAYDEAADRARAAERSKAAVKGHLTRIHNRIANGVCPVGGCKRHFTNLQEHLTTKHPSYRLPDGVV